MSEELIKTYSGDSSHDANYTVFEMIKPNGELVKLRVTNDNVIYLETQE